MIADTLTGKLYVGSATGIDGIWGRQESYIKTGYGDNDKLTELLKVNGSQYADCFQYSILEVADSHATKGYILRQENYWKEVLLTRRNPC